MKRPSVTMSLLHGVGLASLLLLAACGKNDEPAPAAPPAASSVTPAAPVTPPAAMPAAPHSTIAPASSVAVATAGSAAGAAPTALASLAFGKLTLGDAVDKSHQVTRAANRFDTNDHTLYASVATVGSSSNATINAKWHYLEGQGQLVSSISQSIATDGPAVTTFELHNPDRWPEGQYQVDISIDGKPATSQHFEITKSP